jgi:hypothetical protein
VVSISPDTAAAPAIWPAGHHVNLLLPRRSGRRSRESGIVFGLRVTALGCQSHHMKQWLATLIFLAVLSSGAAYGNTFFKGFVGVWKQKAIHSIDDGPNSFTWKSEHTTRVSIVRNGTLYSYSSGVIDGKKSIVKSWSRSDGTYRGESYLGGKKIDEGTGTWRVDKRKRLITGSRDYRGRRVTSIIRRVNKDKFLATTTSEGGRTTSEAVITRIRK